MNLDHAVPLLVTEINCVITRLKFVVATFHTLHLVRHVDIGFEFISRWSNSGIVNQNINPTVMSDNSIDRGVKRFGVRHVKDCRLARNLIGD